MWTFSSLSVRGDWGFRGARGDLNVVWKIGFWNPILFPSSRPYKPYRVPLWSAAWNQHWTGAGLTSPSEGPLQHHTTTASNYLNHPRIICLCAIYGLPPRARTGARRRTSPLGSDVKKQIANPHQSSGWVVASCQDRASITHHNVVTF